MKHLKKLLNVKIFLATVANIAGILLLLNVVNADQIEIINSIAGLVTATLAQIGIMTTNIE